jgi:glutathione S-transferase
MSDYTLYYWPAPFRGQFVRAVLAHAGASWREAAVDEVVALMEGAPADQPVAHMGPPALIDHAAGVTLAQTQAILEYLGRKHALLPNDAVRDALTAKVIADTNDVLYEMTLYNGARMWTPERWEAYRPRLARWMAIFEAHGRRHGLTAETGYLLGTGAPSLADLTAATLWGVMTAKLPALRPLLDDSAPALAGLCDRVARLPEQADLQARSDDEYGDTWCGGQIEASLRAVL